MHLLVDANGDWAVDTRNVLNKPEHECVAPPGGVRVGRSLVSSETNLSQASLNKRSGIGDQQACTANLAHGCGDEVTEYNVDIDVIIGQLRRQSVAPLLEECLATRIGRQVRCRGPAGERAHGEDETALALLEDRCDDLCNLQCTQAVDCDNIFHLFGRRVEERHGDAVALADVVDQDGNVETADQLLKVLVVCIVILGEIHGQRLDFQSLVGILLLDFGREGFELGVGSGDENEVEALAGELGGVFFAQSIRGTGDNGPGAGLAILAKLFSLLAIRGPN